jgi:hypothetical protein
VVLLHARRKFHVPLVEVLLVVQYSLRGILKSWVVVLVVSIRGSRLLLHLHSERILHLLWLESLAVVAALMRARLI